MITDPVARPVDAVAFPLPPLLVVPWVDPVVDQLGFDPRSAYVEQFWLPLLGPTSTWLLRRFASEFETKPDGFSLDASDLARSLGIGTRGGSSGPFPRSVERLVRFGLAHHADHGILTVRRAVPVLTRPQARRLPRPLQAAHERLHDQPRHRSGRDDTHAVRLARTLIDVGADAGEVEAQLRRWNFDETATRRALRTALAAPVAGAAG